MVQFGKGKVPWENNGGAMVEATIRAVDPVVSFESVHARCLEGPREY
jgi:hypothetical protein